MGSNNSLLDRASAVVFDRLEAVGGDPRKLPHPLRVVAIVYSAQGIIGNGGLQYFFEADFPGKPPYAVFVEAYEAIGLHDAAAFLEQAVALFPFAAPHRSVRKRNAFLNSFRDEDGRDDDSPFTVLGDKLCGDPKVWKALAAFVKKHRAAFGLE